MKIKFWVYASENGDGSCGARVFKTCEAAEVYGEAEEEETGMGFNADNVTWVELEVDENGNILTPDPEIIKYDY